MAQINIRRDHHFSLAKARKIAWQWAEDVERDFDMECTVLEGDDEDVVEFTRSGVSGKLTVNKDHFDLSATLGFLLGAFAKTIEAQIEARLDELLAGKGEKGSNKPSAASGKVVVRASKTASKGSRAKG